MGQKSQKQQICSDEFYNSEDACKPAKEFRLKISVRNNRLIKLKEESGLTIPQFCKMCGINVSDYHSLASMKRNPKNKDGSWRTAPRRIAETFRIHEDYIFSNAVQSVDTPSIEKEASMDDVILLCAPIEEERLRILTPEQLLAISERNELITNAIAKLPDRYARVLHMVFGFDDNEDNTLAATAKEFGVTRERARQIFCRALYELERLLRRREAYLLNPMPDP